MKFFFIILIFALSLPGFAQEDDEATIEQIQNARQKQLEKIQALNLERSKPASVPESISKLGYNELTFAAMTDERVVHILRQTIAKSSMDKITQETAKSLILEKSKGTVLESFLQRNPRLLACAADLIRDKKAMTSALGIFLRGTDLKIYFFIWVSFIILGWLFKKIICNPEWARWKLILVSIGVSVLVSLGSFSTFYRIFKAELSPSAAIILKHWKS